jgi:hypothetical protein
MSTKYQAGDSVTVRGVIYHISKTDGIGVKFARSTPCSPALTAFDDDVIIGVYVAESAIATHTPKPRDFKPDDYVYSSEPNLLRGVRLIVIAVAYGLAWVKIVDGHTSAIVSLADLRHA